MTSGERPGEKAFLNGDTYVGTFKGTIPHGKGKYTWSDGTVYEGDWEEGLMTGKGKMSWSSKGTYEGDFSGGHLHGFGTFTGNDGSIYTGAWRMNIQHGVGKKQYCNSDSYEGFWREGLRHGTGRYSWVSGNTYTGNWRTGTMCGRGFMRWTDGDTFDGIWLNGFRHGSGIYRFTDGGFYCGTWSRGLKDGKGTFYPAGNKDPPLKKWYSSIGFSENRLNLLSGSALSFSEDSKVSNPVVNRSLSERISASGFLGNSGRISHRTSSLDEDGATINISKHSSFEDVSCTFSQTSDEELHDISDSSSSIFEREYMQGVLIKEKKRSCKEMSRKSKLQNRFCEKETTEKSYLRIWRENRSYYLRLNLQLGIRYTVGKITPVPTREVRSSDFGDRARIRMYFPRKGSQFTPPHYSINFYWKDYCPMVFSEQNIISNRFQSLNQPGASETLSVSGRNLREMFKLDAAEYMMSICGDDGLREISSPGKSGSIFYISEDDRFVIKTLKSSELKVLLKMLPEYYDHVGKYENTLITKFFGLHQITVRGGRKVRFIVMGNMFCTELRIHRRYDLKGSSLGRCTNKAKISENTTLKDLDLCYEFQMDPLLRDALFTQIYLDCKFLESQQIIDYSLLLGLHFRAPEHLKALLEHPEKIQENEISDSGEPVIVPQSLLLVTHEPSFARRSPGPHIRGKALRAFSVGEKEVDLLLPETGRVQVQLGVNMPAKANHKIKQDEGDSGEVELFEVYDVILYFGIIDILQEYNLKKKAEHAYKSIRFDPLSISVVEPKLYSRRFINFLDTKVFPDQL